MNLLPFEDFQAAWRSPHPDLRGWTDRRERRPEAHVEFESARLLPRLCRGFSLVEMMVSLTVLLVITGAAFSLMGTYQNVSQTEELKADMYQSLRGAVELMAQEIGQAGLVSLPSNPQPTLSAAVTASAAAQTVAISSATSMFVGEKLLVDNGTSEELVTLTGVSTASITGVFGNAHASGAVIKALGVFPNGVMPSSTATQLRIFGDINADGSLVYVHYDCNTTAGTFTRSITTITPSVTASNASETLLTDLVANPDGTACFQYTTATAGSYTFVTNVGITLSVQTSVADPQTGQFLTMTKSLLNLAPRNVLIGLELANVPFTARLQPTPTNLPLS
jgi:prepilin-type N-terminal cleavage/methylation domain-containing protein